VRDGRIQTQGWTEDADRTSGELFAFFESAPIAGFLCTNVDREGKLEGADLSWAAELRASTQQLLCVTGGITSLDDLRALARIGVEEVVVGTALYLGRIDVRALRQEFGS
ncbi:MAG: 1-(5-phosphoribosyl)-5-((5-phosphoribosylamino)methylideneamino)imidazole-4-carboxamide isomerase, partial [Candidatus Eisenbacteria bacterium]|nr:1-(5-phosphoribosyl)-5-((5-phosphoribosylamino)methylideneamino)imidazole-4-carboxamide isomerase [Candidatus Eisenbacteria bacterium]